MINIATPTILNKANGSCAENTSNISLHKIADSFFESADKKPVEIEGNTIQQKAIIIKNQ